MLDDYQITKDPSINQPSALVLVLHGGTNNPKEACKPYRKPWPGPWRQTERIRDGLRHRFDVRGIAVWTLRHRLAGWDRDDDPTPVREARECLTIGRRESGDVPVVLIGHSMGGRTATRVSDEPGVVGVVGLAPWLPENEPITPLAGKSLCVAHAKLDWECGWESMAAFLREAEIVADVREESMGLDTHQLLRERRWHDFAAKHALRLIHGDS